VVQKHDHKALHGFGLPSYEVDEESMLAEVLFAFDPSLQRRIQLSNLAEGVA